MQQTTGQYNAIVQ